MLSSNTLKTLPGDIIINNVNLTQVDSTKLLGLHIDSDLSWKTHINFLSKLLSRNTGILNKLKNTFPTHILLTLYSTLILPYLNYGILAWGNSAKYRIEKIFIIQKRAIRIVNNVTYLYHTNELFILNRVLKIHDIFILNTRIFMYLLTRNELPNIFTPMFTRNEQIHTYPTRQKKICFIFHVPEQLLLKKQLGSLVPRPGMISLSN